MRLVAPVLRISLLIIAVSITLLPPAPVSAGPPALVAETAILIDADTGQVLFERDADRPMEPASTTKIMTAILALEHAALEPGGFDDRVVASAEAERTEGSRIYLTRGEELTLRELLYALMLNSANDSAVAIAEHISGSVSAFAQKMTEKAAEIGARSTRFLNPHGLPEAGHLTTARDLALIARYAMNDPTFREIVATREITVSWPVKPGEERLLSNHNKLLWTYEGADGVKNGYTVRAGHTLVASATRDGRRLIAVVMKSSGNALWADAARLLDHGFNDYTPAELLKPGEEVGTAKVRFGRPVPAVAGAPFRYNFPAGGQPQVDREISWQDLAAPLRQGQAVGEAIFYVQGKEIGRVGLVAGRSVPRPVYTRWWFWLLALYALFRLRVAIRRYRRHRRLKRHLALPRRRQWRRV